MHEPTCIFGANLTPFSLQAVFDTRIDQLVREVGERGKCAASKPAGPTVKFTGSTQISQADTAV